MSDKQKVNIRWKRLRLLLPFFVLILMVFFLYTKLYKPSVEEIPLAQLNKAFPPFSLSSLQNPKNHFSKKDLLGKPALVNVWATWCFSCKVEHAFLLQLSKQGIPIYGINYKDDRVQALQWLKEQGNPYIFSVMDNKGILTTDLGVTGAPETFLIDAKGIIRFHHAGALDEEVWNDKLLPYYQSLLAKQKQQ